MFTPEYYIPGTKIPQKLYLPDGIEEIYQPIIQQCKEGAVCMCPDEEPFKSETLLDEPSGIAYYKRVYVALTIGLPILDEQQPLIVNEQRPSICGTCREFFYIPGHIEEKDALRREIGFSLVLIDRLVRSAILQGEYVRNLSTEKEQLVKLNMDAIKIMQPLKAIDLIYFDAKGKIQFIQKAL